MVALILLPYFLVMLYALFSRNGKNKHVGYLGSIAGLLTILLTFLAWKTPQTATSWFTISTLSVQFSFMTDQLALLLAGVVGLVGTFVFLYSVGYFEEGEDLQRYYFLLSLFATSMLGVVIAGNLFFLFFMWELVGISSYFLIGFWQHKPEAVRAARKAIMTIVLGDIFFLAGIVLLWYRYQTFDIITILQQISPDTMTWLAGIGIIIGGISKSAQFPLHDWLPDAMEGPTPVSAFLHSATMVKAGLFLIARFLPLLVLVHLTPWIIVIALITIIISALMALVETDIKRVLAYSTMNQLAFILLALGVGALTAGMFHLLTHSVFKALLFFSAGVAIHVAGTQDLREIRLRPDRNLFNVATLVGVLALAGIFPLSGFFSKDTIFEGVLHSGSIEIIVVFCIAIVLSAAYIFRWFFLLYAKNGRKMHAKWESITPMVVLAIIAVVLGGFASMFFGFWNAEAPNYMTIYSVLSTVLALLGVGVAYMIYVKKYPIKWLSESAFAETCRERFLVNGLYGALGGFVLGLGKILAKFDDAIIDGTTQSIATFTLWSSKILRRLQSGHTPTYVAIMIIGFIFLVLALGVFA